MKKIAALALAILIAPGLCTSADEAGVSAKPEVFTILRYYDHARQMSYKLVNREEFKALQDELAAEAKLWGKVMSESEKAWKADAATAKKTFPKTAISQKKIQIVDTFTDSEKATSKMNNLEEALSETEEAERKRVEEQEKKRTETARKMLGDRAVKKKSDSGVSEREAFLESARSLFENKMSELTTGMMGSQSPVAPQSAQPAEKKK